MNKTQRIELMLSVVTGLLITAIAFIVTLNTQSLVTPLQAQNGVRLTPTLSGTSEWTVSILNGGFERVGKRGLPKGWNVSALKTGDRVRCNLTNRPGSKPDLIYAHTGECAFQFVGKPGTNSTLAQNITFKGLENYQDVQITAYIQGKNIPTDAAKLVLTIAEERGGLVFYKQYLLKLGEGNYDYTPVAHRVRVVAHYKLKNLKLRLIYSGDAGKLLVDNVQVEAFPLPTVTDTPTPQDTPTPTATSTPSATATDTATATETVRPSNTPFAQPTQKPGSGGE